MGALDYLAGEMETRFDLSGRLPEPGGQGPLSLQVLFPARLQIDPERMILRLRSYHSQLSQAGVRIPPALIQRGYPVGLVRWGQHRIRLVGFSAPMPPHRVEICLRSSGLSEELRTAARQHAAHVVLTYEGYDRSPLEQYVALAIVAASLAGEGALLVLNETARVSLPARALVDALVAGDKLDLLRSLPAPVLYAGIGPLEGRHGHGGWVRTYGNQLLGATDLAIRADRPEEEREVFDIFSTITQYQITSGARIAAGHTMQVSPDTFIRLREPRPDEYFLEGQGHVLVTERIRQEQINLAPYRH